MTSESSAGIIEGAAEELMAVEPEVVQGGNTQIDIPFPDNARLSNFIRFHHPDGTHSDLAAPTFNPKRPTPYRRRFLQHWTMKRGPNGGRWYFLKRQTEAPELPLRCFVQPGGFQCTRRVRNPMDLYMHVMTKHGEESKMYADVLEAMKQKMQAQIDPETLAALGLGPTEENGAKEAQESFYCRLDGCSRFFDKEPSRNQHEYTCPQKPKKEE